MSTRPSSQPDDSQAPHQNLALVGDAVGVLDHEPRESIGKPLHPVPRRQCFQYQAVILGSGASRSRARSFFTFTMLFRIRVISCRV